jgi:hypothetical protein
MGAKGKSPLHTSNRSEEDFMAKIKWLLIATCVCLLLSPQSNIFASQPKQAGEHRSDPDAIHRMITEAPAPSFLPLGEPDTSAPTAPPMLDGTRPAWAKAVFQSFRNNNWDLYMVDASGANEIRLTSETSSEVYPSLAKGGERVAYASNRSGNYEIFVSNVNGTGLKKLADNPNTDTYPVWSPDASRIAFQSNRDGNYNIYLVNPDGSNLVRLTDSSAYDGEMTWSPDGSQLAFVSNRSSRYEIWVMNADGSAPHQITSNSMVASPSWSPRGDKIAYANDWDSDGYYGLWWMNPDGTDQNTLVVSGSPDTWSPSWSPDGKFFSFIITFWSYGKSEGWTESYTGNRDPYFNESYGSQSTDLRVMRISWASTDITPPGPCAIQTTPIQFSDSFSLTWSAPDSESGAIYFDVQMRKLPAGAWQDVFDETRRSGGIMTGNSGDLLEFRCRARDLSLNLGDWGAPPYASTQIYSMRPTSSATVSSRYVGGNTVRVYWTGKGLEGLALRYDIFVRDGPDGNWTLWLAQQTGSWETFTGIPGHTYYFRSQARDLFQHTQVWQPEAQTSVTFALPSLAPANLAGKHTNIANKAETVSPVRTGEQPLFNYLPFITRNEVAPPLVSTPPSDWPTFGNDLAHTKYSANAIDAPRYTLVWSINRLNATNIAGVDQVVSADGVVVGSQIVGSTLSVFAYDASSGWLLWEKKFPSSSHPPFPSIANGNVYIAVSQITDMGTLICVDLHTGVLHWETNSYKIYNSRYPLVIGQNIYTGNVSYDSLYVYNTADGNQVTYAVLPVSPAWKRMDWLPAFANGRIYSWVNGIFSEHDPANSKVLWDLALAWNQTPTNYVPVIANQTALAVSSIGLHAIDLDTHQSRWTAQGAYTLQTPAVAGDTVYAINGASLEARRLSDGALLNAYLAPAPLRFGPIVTGTKVLVATVSTTYLLDRQSMQVIWTAPDSGWLTLANGYLFIMRPDGYLNAYRAEER